MKLYNAMKTWMIAGLVAVVVTACATTQEEMIGGDGAPIDDQAQTGMVDDGTISGADATGLDGADGGDGTAIVGDMDAISMLEQTEGALANRTIYFEFDSAKLSSESIQILETHGNFIAGNGEVSVRLEGHADERGSREYNIALGDRRAQSVEAWSKNRRVELIYTVN
jgi:peptidoglycan-associated lipoprotein